MAGGLEITLNVLSKSRNEAAGPALLASLQTPDDSVLNVVLKALVSRRKKSGHLEVLKRWHTLNPEQQKAVLETNGHMSGALRDAILSDDEQLYANACQVVEECSEYDLVSTLITLAENQKSKHAKTATALIQRLVDKLCNMLHGKRDYSDRRDPERIRRHIIESLERSVERFRQHQRQELVEVFVMLGGNSSSLLRSILEDPRHACYLTVINTLTNSTSSGVINHLFKALESEFTSGNLLNVISKRTDDTFVKQFLEYTQGKLSSKALKNIGRIRTFAWLESEKGGFNSFDEQDKARAVRLVGLSGVKQDAYLQLLEKVLRHNSAEIRLAACEAIRPLQGPQANQLILDYVYDEDPRVQAVCISQLRDRHISGAMSILIRLSESPHELVRNTVRDSLSEFTFANFIAGYDSMKDEIKSSTSALVKKVDPETIPRLQEEMESPTGKRRIRAIEIAELMQLIPELSAKVIELLQDEDHMVRAYAADALSCCGTAQVRKALMQAKQDPNTSVQNAAKSSLAVLSEPATVQRSSTHRMEENV